MIVDVGHASADPDSSFTEGNPAEQMKRDHAV